MLEVLSFHHFCDFASPNMKENFGKELDSLTAKEVAAE